MNNKINHVGEIRHIKALEYVLIVWAASLPLLFSVKSFAQTSLLNIIVSAAFIALFYLLLIRRQIVAQLYEIKSGRLLYILVAYILTTIISTIFSLHLHTALWGKYGRFEGLFSLFIYAGAFLAAAGIDWKVKHLHILEASMSVVAGLISTYALSQYFGFDLIVRQTSFGAGRAYAHMGNPVFLGSYLALIFPLALTVYFSAENRYKRLIYSGVNLIILGAVIVTFSRGAWLAVFIGGAAVIIAGIRGKTIACRQVVKLIAMFLLVVFILGALSLTSRHRNLNLLNRMQSGLNLNGGSISSRLEIWQAALKIIAKRPLVGYGPDNFAWVYPKHKTLKAAGIESDKWRIDNAHNWWLQSAATIGIPAILLLIIFFAWIIYFGFNYKNDGSDIRTITSALAAALAAYLISLLSGISVVGVTSLFWLLAGVLVSFALKPISGRSKPIIYLTVGFYAMIGVLMIFLVLGYGKYYLAEGWYWEALTADRSNNYQSAGVFIGSAIQLVPSESFYQQRAGKFYIDLGKATQNINNFKDAAAQLSKAVELNPNDYQNFAYLATADYYLSNGRNSNILLKAKSEFATAARLAPRNPVLWQRLAIIEMRLGNVKSAEDDIKRALVLDKNNAAYYLILGQIEEEKGLKEKAKKAYLKAVTLQPAGISALEASKRLKILAQ